MRVLFLFVLASLMSLNVMGQTQATPGQADAALNGLGASNWGEAYRSAPAGPDTTPASTREVRVDERERVETACTADQQTSLPYRFFLNLLSSKEVTLTPNPSQGTLTMNTGMMIGNCNNMLNINFAQPQEGRPYLIQVEIRRPAGCSSDVCDYDVQEADGGVATGESKTVSVAPNYYGFVQCLKDTGALDENGVPVADKIAPVEISRTFTGLTSTDQIWFYSHGPEAARNGGVWSNNKKNEGSCRYYEDVAEGGYTYFSQADVLRNRKRALFDEICSSQDYQLIERHLPEFSQFAIMKNILEEVRNNYLRDEVKRLHSELAAAGDDYSNLDADKYQRIINDFYSKVVVPLRRDIELKVAEIARTPEGRQRKALRDELKEMTELLESYAKAPYLNANDFRNMKSFAKKAPLHVEAWRDAAVSLFAINNTAYHFSRYNETTRRERGLDSISTARANELITADVAAERETISNLGRIAGDTDTSVAREYRRRAERVEEARDEYAQATREFEQEELSYLYNHCYNPNKYWVNRQRCAQEVMLNIQHYRDQDQEVYGAMRDEYSDYMEQAQFWSNLESQRDAAYGVQRSGRGGQTTARRQTSSVDPRAMRAPNYSQNYEEFYMRMMQMQQQQGGVPIRGFNPSGYQMSGNWQFQSGLNRGPATSGYWPQRPTAGNYNMNHWGQQQTPMMANPAYNYHLQSSTMYGPMQFRR